MKTDVVIPLKSYNKWDNREICFCLRSIEKHLKGFGKVFIVTDRAPGWLQNVEIVRCADTQHRPQWTTTMKILQAWKAGASENVIVFNDDFYLTAPADAASYPYRYIRRMPSVETPARVTPYSRAMANTVRYLKKRGIEAPGHFGVHCPIVYNREKFDDCALCVDWSPQAEYLTRFLYGNLAGVASEQHNDCKLYHERNESVLAKQVGSNSFFSIADEAIGAGMQRYLLSLYPEPSRFEKPSVHR
jgi:hypothetical protein